MCIYCTKLLVVIFFFEVLGFLIVCGVKTNFNGIHCVLLEVTTKTLLETSQGSIFSIWLPGLIHIWHQLYRFTSAKTLVFNSHLTVSLVFKSCPLKNNPYFRILPQCRRKAFEDLNTNFDCLAWGCMSIL